MCANELAFPLKSWFLSKVIFLIEPGQSRVTRVHEGVFCSNNPSRLLQTLADSAKDNQPKKLSIQCKSFQLLKIWMKHLYTNWNSSTLICAKGGCKKGGWVVGGLIVNCYNKELFFDHRPFTSLSNVQNSTYIFPFITVGGRFIVA